jgi:hypothetical protein
MVPNGPAKALLFRLQSARHADIINDEAVLGTDDKCADIHVAGANQADGIINGEDAAAEEQGARAKSVFQDES